MFFSLPYQLKDYGTQFGDSISSADFDSCSLSEFLEKLRPSLNCDNLPLLIFVNKGIEISTHALTLEIITDTLGADAAKASTFIVSAHLALGSRAMISWRV